MKTEAKKEFYHRVSQIGKAWGLGEPAGRIWGVLLLSDKPLAQREVAEEAGYSLGLVSTSIRILDSKGVIALADTKGREKQYYLQESFFGSFGLLFRQFVELSVRPMLQLLEENKGVKGESGKKVDQLIDDYNRLMSVFELMNTVFFTDTELSDDKLKTLRRKVKPRARKS